MGNNGTPDTRKRRTFRLNTSSRFFKGGAFLVVLVLTASVVQVAASPDTTDRSTRPPQNHQQHQPLADEDSVPEAPTAHVRNKRARVAIAKVSSSLVAMRQRAVDALEKLIAGNRRGGARTLMRIRVATGKALESMRGVSFPSHYRALARKLKARLKGLRAPTLAAVRTCGPLRLQSHWWGRLLDQKAKTDVRKGAQRMCRAKLNRLVRYRLDDLQEVMSRIRPLLQP
jgi:hypothetical protein